MIYEYSRSANKSKVTVSCEIVKSRTLALGVIKESQATEWSQVHLVPKPTPEGQPQKWRFTLDFV